MAQLWRAIRQRLTPRAARPAWAIVGGGGAFVVLYYGVLPSDEMRRWAYDLFCLLAVAAAAVGTLRRPAGTRGPAALIVSSLVLMAGGDLWWDAWPTLTGQDVPTPSPVDAVYLSAYPALALGIVLLIRREVRLTASAVLDSLVVTGGVAVLLWQFLVEPYLTDTTTSTGERLVNSTYPAIDLLVVAPLLLVLFSGGQRSGNLRAAAVGIAGTFCADVGYGLANLNGTYQTGDLQDAGWILQYTLLAAVAYGFPGRAAKQASTGRGALTMPLRIAVLAAAGALAPLMLVARNLMHAPTNVAVLSSFALVMSVLVALRMTTLVLDIGRQALTLSAVHAQRTQLAERLDYRTCHDGLTGLANRESFARHGQRALADGGQYALVLIGVDDFKTLNDHHGHTVGDALLTTVAGRIRDSLRHDDLAARLGGDEFAILLSDVHSPEHARVTAERLREILARPLNLIHNSTRLVLHASIGVALTHTAADLPDSPGDAGARYTRLLACADIAMHAAKQAGKNRVALYHPSMQDLVLGDADLATELREAIASAQLVAYYQPILNLANQQPTSVEALVRWPHPSRGLLNPGQFLPVAQQLGLTADIDLIVFRQAVANAARWRRLNPQARSLRVNVNASADLLRRDDLVTTVLAILTEANLPPEALVLEVTEHAVVSDLASVSARLHELHAHGVRIALDDFGTGFSGLAYLDQFPVDILKIDHDFVTNGITPDGPSRLLLATIGLSRALRLSLVAEGIETPFQARTLREAGTQHGQGFLFQRPLAAADLTTWLRTTTLPARGAVALSRAEPSPSGRASRLEKPGSARLEIG